MTQTRKYRVAVAMSGGVDSSVTAVLLKSQGFDCFGVTMLTASRDIPADKGKRVCYGLDQRRDVEDAAAQAEALRIPHFVIDLREAFETQVIDYFKREYLAGRTPNPCVRCNETIKFDSLIRETRRVAGEFDMLATGHFCRVQHLDGAGRWALLRGQDQAHDQSYFLYRLGQEVLSRVMFPLAEMDKAQVRELAMRFGLKSAHRPKSVDFVVPRTFPVLFGKPRPGPIKDLEGRVVGKHQGIERFTIGQRHGIGVASGGRLYVIALEPETNTVVVGPREALMFKGLMVAGVNWVSMACPRRPLDVLVQIRLNQQPARARVQPIGCDRVRVEFNKPVFAVAPGQSAVFYDGAMVLGGGVIERGIRG